MFGACFVSPPTLHSDLNLLVVVLESLTCMYISPCGPLLAVGEQRGDLLGFGERFAQSRCEELGLRSADPRARRRRLAKFPAQGASVVRKAVGRPDSARRPDEGGASEGDIQRLPRA